MPALGAVVVLATIDNGLVLLGIPESSGACSFRARRIVLAATADVIIAGQVRSTLRRAPPHRQDIAMIRKLPQWELTLVVLTLA